jgi:hypothetical protein
MANVRADTRFLVVKIHVVVFWITTSQCLLGGHLCSAGTYCLSLQGVWRQCALRNVTYETTQGHNPEGDSVNYKDLLRQGISLKMPFCFRSIVHFKYILNIFQNVINILKWFLFYLECYRDCQQSTNS